MDKALFSPKSTLYYLVAKHIYTYLYIFIDLYAIYIVVNFQQEFYGYIKIQGLLSEKNKERESW